MSVSTSQNNLTVIVASSSARTGTQYTDPDAAGYLLDGEVFVVNDTGAILTNAATVGNAPKFRIVQRVGDRIVYSPVVTGANIKAYKGQDGRAATEQVNYVGYNGASGSIDVSGTDDFILNLTFMHDESMWSQQHNNFPFLVENVASITQANVADGLAEAINYQMSNANQHSIAGEGPLVRATVLCNDAGAAITGTGTITAYKGSKTITAGTDIDAVMAVGDYIRIGSTATTGAVYRIVSMDTTAQTATLNMPFQGTSVVASAEGNHEFIDSTLVGAADFGVKIEGQALKWELDFFKYLQVVFRVGYVQGWGSTTSTNTPAVPAIGSGKQIAELESYAEGFRGVLNRTIIPLPSGKQTAVSSTVYDVLTLVWTDTSDLSPIDGIKPSEQEMIICFPDPAGTQATNATNGVKTVLDAYMPTTPLALPAVSL